MIFKRREPTIPVSAVEAIVHVTIEAMKAGGNIGIDMMYPLRHDDAAAADELEGAIADDDDFIQTGGAPPEFEEDEYEPEEDESD